MKELTIVTPTYNRAYTLQKAYNSLVDQTNKSFVWLIIDDGSEDNTEEIVRQFQKEKRIEIQYVKKKNGGKASALNLGLDIITTSFCACLDSDDWFPQDSVEKALVLLHEEENNAKCCGVLSIRVRKNGNCKESTLIPPKYKYINTDIIYEELRLSQEFMCFYKTNIARQYRFPVFPGEVFMPPSWFHQEICKNYVFRTSWDCLCLYEYLPDGLTKNKRKVIVKNPKGYTLIKKISFANSKSLKRKFKNGIMYDCGAIIGKDKEWLQNAPYKMIAILSYPVALFVYFLRFKKLMK